MENIDYKAIILSSLVPELIKDCSDLRYNVNDLISSISDIEWLKSLPLETVSELILRVACIATDVTQYAEFVSIVFRSGIRPNGPTDKQWVIMYKYATKIWKQTMLNIFPNPRDPENGEEEILFCLCACFGSEPLPSKIIKNLLYQVDLDVETPNYHQNVLDVVAESGNIDYIQYILERAILKKKRSQLYEYILDKDWCRNKCDMKYITELENLFEKLDLPFSIAVHGKYSQHCDILARCKSVDVLQICIKNLPKNCKYILQSRAFAILQQFIGTGDEFQYAIELLERCEIDLNVIFKQRCKGKSMSLLDTICLEGQAKELTFILSKMSSEIKIELLNSKNYGFRTPLDHTRYYTYHSNEKEQIILKEMKTFGL